MRGARTNQFTAVFCQYLDCSLLLVYHNYGDFYQLQFNFFLAMLCGSSALIYLGDGQVARHQVKSPISVWNDIMEEVTEASQVQRAQNTLYSLEIC